jgi:conjugal transfer/entry exclusion protein
MAEMKKPGDPAAMQDLWNSEARLAEMILQLGQTQITIHDNLAQTTARLDILTERVDRLTERVDRLTERVDTLAVKVDELAEIQKHTDERLNALISIVDDLVRRQPPAA